MKGHPINERIKKHVESVNAIMADGRMKSVNLRSWWYRWQVSELIDAFGKVGYDAHSFEHRDGSTEVVVRRKGE